MELDHPERFAPTTTSRPIPTAQWSGTIAQLLEVVVALSLTGLLRHPSGQSMNLAEVAKLFGRLLGIQWNDLYGRKSRLLTRKKNESPFLDSLLCLYRKEVEKASL